MKTDNELIAEFMGIQVRFWDKVLYHSDEDGYVDIAGDAAPYWPNKSWNQLMPVVEKIEHDGHEVDIYKNACEIDMDGGMIREVAGNKIEATYKAVVEFIKWYNNEIH